MDAKQRLSVLLDDPSCLATSLPKIARIVAQALGEHPTDVSQKVRYGAGIVVRDVAAPYARDIARNLAQLGLGSFLVERLEPAPRARRVGQLEFDAAGITIAQRLKPPERLEWSKVLALHAHASLDSSSGEDEEGPARRGGDLTQLSEGARRVLGQLREFEDRERARVVLGIDLLVAGPTLYRMTSTDTGIYGALPQRSTTALENYLALVRALVAAAPPSVLVPRTTRRFAVDLEFTRILCAKREELESLNAWTLQALRHGVRAGEAEPEDLADEGLEDAEDAIPLAPDAGAAAPDDAPDELDDADLEEARTPAPTDAPLDHSAYALDAEELDDLEDALERDDKAEGADDDPEVAEELRLFDKTGRLDPADVKKILADARALGAEVDAAPVEAEHDPEVKEALGFFDPAPSGRWDVKQVLEGAEDVAPDELEAADPKPEG